MVTYAWCSSQLRPRGLPTLYPCTTVYLWTAKPRVLPLWYHQLTFHGSSKLFPFLDVIKRGPNGGRSVPATGSRERLRVKPRAHEEYPEVPPPFSFSGPGSVWNLVRTGTVQPSLGPLSDQCGLRPTPHTPFPETPNPKVAPRPRPVVTVVMVGRHGGIRLQEGRPEDTFNIPWLLPDAPGTPSRSRLSGLYRTNVEIPRDREPRVRLLPRLVSSTARRYQDSDSETEEAP